MDVFTVREFFSGFMFAFIPVLTIDDFGNGGRLATILNCQFQLEAFPGLTFLVLIMNGLSNPSQQRPLNRDLLYCCLMIAIGVASRELLESWPNFKPVGAICILAGLLVSRLWLAVMVPPVMMAISDFGIGGAGFGLAIAVQIALIANLGSFRLLRNRFMGDSSCPRNFSFGKAAKRNASGAMLIGAGSFQFFLTTNFAFWATTSWYSPDLTGLVSCYVAAIPFFWNTLGGDLLFAGMPLVAFQMARSLSPSLNAGLADPITN